MYYSFVETPTGTLLFVGDGQVVSGIHWKVFKRTPAIAADWTENKQVFTIAIRQFEEYFEGTRTTFDFPYAAKGTSFQEAVWKEIAKLSFGETTTYQRIAVTLGKPKAVRAVGTAVGSNPHSIIVPCHRVLATSGKLGGYAGGLESKKMLLSLESISYAA
jgi:methylated-DNA-[protein]-cysteine S-methyltransferase